MVDLTPPKYVVKICQRIYEESNKTAVRELFKRLMRNTTHRAYIEIMFSITQYINLPFKGFTLFSGFEFYSESDYIFRKFLYYASSGQNTLARKYFMALTDDFFSVLKVLTISEVEDICFDMIASKRMKLFWKDELFYNILKLNPVISETSGVRIKKWGNSLDEGIVFPVYRLKTVHKHKEFTNIKTFQKIDGKLSFDFFDVNLLKLLRRYFLETMNVFFVFVWEKENNHTTIIPLFFSYSIIDYKKFLAGRFSSSEFLEYTKPPEFEPSDVITIQPFDFAHPVHTPEELFQSLQDFLYGVMCYNHQGIFKLYPKIKYIYSQPVSVNAKKRYLTWEYFGFRGSKKIPDNLNPLSLQVKLMLFYVHGEVLFVKAVDVVEDAIECVLCNPNSKVRTYQVCLSCCTKIKKLYHHEEVEFAPVLDNGIYQLYCPDLKKTLKLDIEGAYVEVEECSPEEREILPPLDVKIFETL